MTIRKPIKYHSDSLKDCPSKEKHTPSPDGYMQWHSWAEKMIKTHRQIRCDDCKKLAIWVPK